MEHFPLDKKGVYIPGDTKEGLHNTQVVFFFCLDT